MSLTPKLSTADRLFHLTDDEESGMRVGQARKRDWNEKSIVDALRSIGVDVWRLSGEGVPDLLTHSRGKWLPIEVKRPRGKLTPAQRDLRRIAPFPVVETEADALALFGVDA